MGRSRSPSLQGAARRFDTWAQAALDRQQRSLAGSAIACRWRLARSAATAAKDRSCDGHDSCLYRGRRPRGRRIVRTRVSGTSLEFTGRVRVLLPGDALRQPVARPRGALLGSRGGGRPHLRVLRSDAATNVPARAPGARGGGLPVHGGPPQAQQPHGAGDGESISLGTAGPYARRWSKRPVTAAIDGDPRGRHPSSTPPFAPAPPPPPLTPPPLCPTRPFCPPPCRSLA